MYLHSSLTSEPSDDAWVPAIDVDATIESLPLRHHLGCDLDAIPLRKTHVLTTGALHRAQGAPVCHLYTHYVTIRDFACTQIFQPRDSRFRHEPSDDAGIQAINIEATIESVPLRHLMGRALDANPVDQSTSIKPEP